MDKPTLSIVMPVFNHADWVKVMVDSIRANDFVDWELWVVDDGSDAETVATLECEFCNEPRIHYITRGDRQPKGAQTCRNIGMESAQGEYVIFFDSDDYVAPYCLRQRVENMRKHPDLDFMVFPSGVYNGAFLPNGSEKYGYPIYKDDFKAFLHRTLPFIVWTNIYRTAVLRKHQLMWDTNLLSYQDSDFNIQALLHGLRYEYAVAKPDYGYRTEGNAGSISKKIQSEAHRQSILYFLDKQYRESQRYWGAKYDRDVYLCTLFLYSNIMASKMDISFAQQLAAVVMKHDAARGKQLLQKIRWNQFLSRFLPERLSRQLIMPFYLIRKRWTERRRAYLLSKIWQKYAAANNI